VFYRKVYGLVEFGMGKVMMARGELSGGDDGVGVVGVLRCQSECVTGGRPYKCPLARR